MFYSACMYIIKGERTENNLEKAFHWCQRAAENGHTDAMSYLTLCYENGIGTEKNLEKAFYWHQKVVENNKVRLKNKAESLD
ncbi:unnamed protein product [Rhizophagus irregularis]|nr:unnamed protein product [Rhizophagus irregularis]